MVVEVAALRLEQEVVHGVAARGRIGDGVFDGVAAEVRFDGLGAIVRGRLDACDIAGELGDALRHVGELEVDRPDQVWIERRGRTQLIGWDVANKAEDGVGLVLLEPLAGAEHEDVREAGQGADGGYALHAIVGGAAHVQRRPAGRRQRQHLLIAEGGAAVRGQDDVQLSHGPPGQLGAGGHAGVERLAGGEQDGTDHALRLHGHANRHDAPTEPILVQAVQPRQRGGDVDLAARYRFPAAGGVLLVDGAAEDDGALDEGVAQPDREQLALAQFD